MSLAVASMLPTGALWAMNAVHDAKVAFDRIRSQREEDGKVRVLVVGTGTLALWALRLAHYYFGPDHKHLQITVAALKDEGIKDVLEEYMFNVVTWNDQLHEAALLERTVNVAGGPVDIVIDFGTTTRSLLRGLQCLNRGGVVLIGTEASEFLIRRLKCHIDDVGAKIHGVEMGSYDQLKELVDLVAMKKIEPPPYTLFPCDQAAEAVKMVNRGDCQGHGILQFAELLEE
ncbi:unnamed protein product [Cyprideis torosa]|uniref:Uncharacterized protein n=1 Tax=Cyprideis torosa TaxID=163714 RepID=A0A7R8WHJ7_9CRUS|nr:unnamed protein product [Cyprideis torosa]CAG0899431.1 unnamed protein product [Cyprideis torosa]